MIALRYFLYEFSRKFNDVLYELENCECEIDRDICIECLNEIYIPVLNDLEIVLGESVSKIIDTERYLKLAEIM